LQADSELLLCGGRSDFVFRGECQRARKAVGSVIGGGFQSFAPRDIGTLKEEFLARWVKAHARDKGMIGHE
jgi:hypothetical protein